MSFEWKGATISARELTIGDEERISSLLMRLTPGTTSWNTTQYSWAEFQIGAVVKGTAPIPPAGDTDDLSASYEAWRQLPRRFQREWRVEVQRVEGDPNA